MKKLAKFETIFSIFKGAAYTAMKEINPKLNLIIFMTICLFVWVVNICKKVMNFNKNKKN